MRLLLSAWTPALAWSVVLATLAGAPAPPDIPAIPHFDKLAHFGAYAVLGMLLGWGWLRSGGRPTRGWLLAFALLLGASDELRHAHNPARSAEVGDWVADALGAGTGLWLSTRSGRRTITIDDRGNE